MPENPFEQSTLVTDESITYLLPPSTQRDSENVEVRYPFASRVLVPGALALSGVMVPIILYFALQPPLNLTMAAVTAMMELATAASLYIFFNSSFVRADDVGITKSQFGKSQSVRWEEIADMGMKQVGNGPMQMEFRNASGKVIFKCSTLGNRVDGEKLWDLIDMKLQEP